MSGEKPSPTTNSLETLESFPFFSSALCGEVHEESWWMAAHGASVHRRDMRSVATQVMLSTMSACPYREAAPSARVHKWRGDNSDGGGRSHEVVLVGWLALPISWCGEQWSTTTSPDLATTMGALPQIRWHPRQCIMSWCYLRWTRAIDALPDGTALVWGLAWCEAPCSWGSFPSPCSTSLTKPAQISSHTFSLGLGFYQDLSIY
jgi:hypothetical protein